MQFPVLCVFLLACQSVLFAQRIVTDPHGAIVRGDVSKKQIALVFTGDEFADGAATIRETLKAHQAPGSFFLTGNFYRNKAFGPIIAGLLADGHYLGAHSDKHLLYADWVKRDSLLVTEKVFKQDLRDNYERMRQFGIKKDDAGYFLPPYEWYNAVIARWTSEMGLTLINFSPGTRSHADYTYPEMNDRYVSSQAIYQSIIDFEENSANGLNGFILLIHIGTDPRRTDKFYNKLDDLLTELQSKGYTFISLSSLTTRNSQLISDH